MKRVVGLEGDVLEVRKGGSYYDAERGSRKMAIASGGGGAAAAAAATAVGLPEMVVVPPGHVWVEGEHPEGSRWSVDSNTYGPVPLGLLVGRVEAVVWPWARRGWIRWQHWRGCDRARVGGDRRMEVGILGFD